MEFYFEKLFVGDLVEFSCHNTSHMQNSTNNIKIMNGLSC